MKKFNWKKGNFEYHKLREMHRQVLGLNMLFKHFLNLSVYVKKNSQKQAPKLAKSDQAENYGPLHKSNIWKLGAASQGVLANREAPRTNKYNEDIEEEQERGTMHQRSHQIGITAWRK